LVTKQLGDLFYGMYILSFPVQQVVVKLGRRRARSFVRYLSLSFVPTSERAYLSWRLLEMRALQFKPQCVVSA